MSYFSANIKKALKGYGFILPGFFIITSIILYPLAKTVLLSFSKSDKTFLFTLDNYIQVMRAPQFLPMLKRTLIWMTGTVFFSVVIGFGAAKLIDQPFIRGKNIWRSLLLLAWITPGVVKAQAWKWLYSSDFGMLNQMLKTLGIIDESIPWLTKSNIAFIAVLIIQVWSEFPYTMLMISAGLQSISKDHRECALLDGANWFQYTFRVEIPLIKDIVFVAVLISTIWAINTFSVIWIVTQGGPARATTVLSLDIYKKFLMFDLQGASATAMLQLIISLVITVFYLRRANREN